MYDFEQNTYTNGAPKRRQYTTAEDEMDERNNNNNKNEKKNCDVSDEMK